MARRKLIWSLAALGAAIAALWLLWYLAARRGFDWNAFFATLTGLDWRWLLASVLVGLATYINRAFRWAVLIQPVKPHPSLWNLNIATAIGFAAITIFGRPGELVRPYLIAKKEAVPVSSQLAALFLERIYDLLGALLVFGFALSQVRASTVAVGPELAWVLSMGGRSAFAIGAICLLVLFLVRQFAEPMRRRLIDALGFLPPHLRERAEKLANAFVQGVQATRSLRSLVLLAALTIVEWVLIALCFAAMVRAFGGLVHMDMVDVLIFMGFVAFGAIVQIPGVGGGFQVVAVLVLTRLFGLRLEAATSVAMLMWAVSFLVIVPIGLLLALHEGLSLRKLRDLGQEAGS
ncbi:MAG: flippase-like domain-containing protein [Acidobacteria bacterium]|nr:flippase-like domain-containing protein [Acidobacteriota bacterium]